MAAPVQPIGDRAFCVDAGAVAAISLAIALAAHRLPLMTGLVAGVFAVRLAVWMRLPVGERGGAFAEMVTLIGCTAVGAFNDWSSVVRHHVYDYRVPVFFPELSTIPLWMLLFWGLVLRFLISLFRWRRVDPAPRAGDQVYLLSRRDSPGLRIALMLALVLATRQCIYRFYEHPIGSWLPFAGALIAYGALFRPGRRERWLAGLFLVGGPLIEIAYIQWGGLHRYHQGLLAGVPVWIALWWPLAALIWRDLTLRIVARRHWPRPARSPRRQPHRRRGCGRGVAPRWSGGRSVARTAALASLLGDGLRDHENESYASSDQCTCQHG